MERKPPRDTPYSVRVCPVPSVSCPSPSPSLPSLPCINQASTCIPSRHPQVYSRDHHSLQWRAAHPTRGWHRFDGLGPSRQGPAGPGPSVHRGAAGTGGWGGPVRGSHPPALPTVPDRGLGCGVPPVGQGADYPGAQGCSGPGGGRDSGRGGGHWGRGVWCGWWGRSRGRGRGLGGGGGQRRGGAGKVPTAPQGQGAGVA